MRWEVPDYTLVHSLAYDTAGDVLYVLTPRSVYRAAAPADPSSRLELVAGSEEASGCVDGGYGRAALFGSICDAAVDGAGRLLVLDMEGPGGGAVVRVVDPRAGYAVSSVQPALGDLSGHAGRLDLLPSGELLILLARCEYLRFQINQQKAQGVTGKFSIPIDDADAEAFWLLLRHIYTGRVDFPPLMVEPVLQLAERMRMQRSADIIRTLLHPSSSTADGSQQSQQQPQQAQQQAASGYGQGAAASTPSPYGGEYGAYAAPAAAPAAAQQSPYGYSATTSAPPYGGPSASPYAAAAAGAPSPYGPPPAAAASQSPYGPPSAQTPYGAPPAASAQTPYGAPPAASGQTPYGQTPYGAPPAAGAQTPYGQTPYGAPPATSAQTPYGQTPYGAPLGASPYAYGAPPQQQQQQPAGYSPYGGGYYPGQQR
eukprot:XP_001703456.1 hypothetical protein CHLREDRAFT_188181 [Chlamydomonas reinhardtii]